MKKKPSTLFIVRDICIVFFILFAVFFIVFMMFLEQSGFWEGNKFQLPPEAPIRYTARYLSLKYPDTTFVFKNASGEAADGGMIFYFTNNTDEDNEEYEQNMVFPYSIYITKEYSFKYHAVDDYYKIYIQSDMEEYTKSIFDNTDISCNGVLVSNFPRMGLYEPAFISIEQLVNREIYLFVNYSLYILIDDESEAGNTLLNTARILNKKGLPGTYEINIEYEGTTIMEQEVVVS